MRTFQIHLEIIAQIMRTSLLITFLSFITFAQATPSPEDLVSSDSLEIQIRQNESLYEVLRLHRKADELSKMFVVGLEQSAIIRAELARTQQMKEMILGGLDLSFYEFAAKVSPRWYAKRALIKENKNIELILRRLRQVRIKPRNKKMWRMCEADNLLEWSVCVSPYHAFESNQKTITLTASNALLNSFIKQMRSRSKRITTPLKIASITFLTAIMVPAVVLAIALGTL